MTRVIPTAILGLLLLGSGPSVAEGLEGATRLDQAEALVPHIWKCMDVTDGAVEANVTAKIQVRLVNGYVIGEPLVLKRPTSALETAMLKAALDAVRLCNPYPSGITLTANVTFVPNDLEQ